MPLSVAVLLLIFLFAFDRCGDRSCLDGTLDTSLRVGAAGIAAMLLGSAALTIGAAVLREPNVDYARAGRRAGMLGLALLIPWVLLLMWAGVATG